MDFKGLQHFEVKNAARGEVEAVFSTFNQVDHDGDVTLPGALADGAPVRISAYGHASWNGVLPAGKGIIRTTPTEAILQGQFFLETTTGRDTFNTIVGLGDLQEWSYGFDILPGAARKGNHHGQSVRFLQPLPDGSAGLVAHEVSPVLLGAGIGTRTLATKSVDDRIIHPTLAEARRHIREWEDERAADEAKASEYLRSIAGRFFLQEAHDFLVELDSQPEFFYSETRDPDWETKALAEGLLRVCADEFGIPPHKWPQLMWFDEETPAERAYAKERGQRDWPHIPVSPTRLRGIWDSYDNRVWVKVGQSLDQMVDTVAHEVAHAAGHGHPYADDYGKRWAKILPSAT